MCARSGGAEVCLVGTASYRLTASGLQPGSEVRLAVNGQETLPVKADEEGRLTRTGTVVGVVRGQVDQKATITATTAEGVPATFEIDVPGAGN